MHHLGRAALATVTAAAAAAAVVGAGSADAAPKYTATFPVPISGRSTTGVEWQGFLLNRAQTAKFHNEGWWTRFSWWDPAAYNTEMVKAFKPGRGAGCIVLVTLTRNGKGAMTLADGPNYIRTEDFATRKPDAPNALYWSTKNFQCV